MFFNEIGIDKKFFHPHEFTDDYARKICSYTGKDLYYAILANNTIIGYGMLRGWDEGFDVPSLGIIISSSARGLGIGKMFISFLHCAAKMKESKAVMLKVHTSNVAAVRLYKSVGYILRKHSDNELIGYYNL